MMPPLAKLAVVCDFLEEQWFSMDLVAEMLVQHLQTTYADTVQTVRLCPPFIRRLSQLPLLGKQPVAINADRILNRFADYSRWLRQRHHEFNLFHIIDHSYAHLVHVLPPHRTIVTCHDLDAFRCLLEPASDPRSKLFQTMTKRMMLGFVKAARVTCDSVATRDALLAHDLVPPERITVIPNGIHPSCSPYANLSADQEASRLLGPRRPEVIDVLHIGSTIPRKRIDVLLRLFAALHARFPQTRLMRVGGPFTCDQAQLLQQLDIEDAVVVLPFVERPVLAAIYRRAALMLQPSEKEGFGLPVVEAMACGTPVVASDLPVLREVGGESAIYCPVADVPAWVTAVTQLLRERQLDPERMARRRAAALAQSTSYSWAEYTRSMVAIYQELLAA